MAVGDKSLIPTAYIKDGTHVCFALQKIPLKITILGKVISLFDVGIGLNTDLDTITVLLSQTKLCRGGSGGSTVWKNIHSDDVHMGTMSKFCKIVIPSGQSMCHSCRLHSRYLMGKENQPPVMKPAFTSQEVQVDEKQSEEPHEPKAIGVLVQELDKLLNPNLACLKSERPSCWILLKMKPHRRNAKDVGQTG